MKIVGSCFYVHKSAVQQFTPEQREAVAHALCKIPVCFEYDIIKYNRNNGAVTFTQSPDWDTANEPLVGDSYTVRANGTVKRINKSRGQIYHHKWLFVKEDYTGFNVEESKHRSKIINEISVGLKQRIGYKKFWIELLAEHGVEV